MPKTSVLPRPTWTKSDNNLLPKYIEMLKKRGQTYAQIELQKLRNRLEVNQSRLQEYKDSLIKLQQRLAEYRRKLNILQTEVRQLTDEEIRIKFDELIAQPEVLGTRIGPFGELILLVRPIMPTSDQYDWGTYELSAGAYRCGDIALAAGSTPGIRKLLWRTMSAHEVSWVADFGYRSYRHNHVAPTDALAIFDLQSLIEWLRATLSDLTYYPGDYLSPVNPEARPPWTGHVADPVSAMRRLVELSNVVPIEKRIADVEESIRSVEADSADYRNAIRQKQSDIREYQAEIAKQERLLTNNVTVDYDQAREELAYITALQGVIGVRFDHNGNLLVHVRNSIVHQGKRYDLGDFTISTEYDSRSTFTIRRTRQPLSGDYSTGWHDDYFCFGNQADVIRSLYTSGDIGHAFHHALAMMNTVSEGDFRYLEQGDLLREIPLDDVWKRHMRQRKRRRPKP